MHQSATLDVRGGGGACAPCGVKSTRFKGGGEFLLRFDC